MHIFLPSFDQFLHCVVVPVVDQVQKIDVVVDNDLYLMLTTEKRGSHNPHLEALTMIQIPQSPIRLQSDEAAVHGYQPPSPQGVQREGS